MSVHQVSRNQALAASKFLTQATLGANYPTITQVAKQGESAWLDAQFQQPIHKLLPQTKCWEEVYESLGEQAAAEAFGDMALVNRYLWFNRAITAPDLLRQRVAMALSEILVVSDRIDLFNDNALPMSAYYDVLLEHSFGNFRDLLSAVTLHPAMGVYLSHVNNAKADTTKGTFPDENYAREVMQLFSIGLFELNQDGTRKKDANGKDIATYNNATIREFAKVFTGLSYGGEDAQFTTSDDVENFNFEVPMVMFDAHHDKTAKHLLNGKVLPAGQGGMTDINAAIDNLFNHPNVAPFIGKLLIQRLVTSNPSKAYVSRVSAAFNGGNGQPRGDMKNVIRAILLDPEARQTNTVIGAKLKEPFIRYVHLLRAFNANTADGAFMSTGEEIEETIHQFVMSSPSVFNFFQSGFAPNGEIKQAGLTAPEFQIVNAATVIGLKNLLFRCHGTGRAFTHRRKVQQSAIQSGT